MEIVRLLTRRFEDLIAKYKIALSQTQTENWDQNRRERHIKRDGKVVLELKRRSPDIDG